MYRLTEKGEKAFEKLDTNPIYRDSKELLDWSILKYIKDGGSILEVSSRASGLGNDAYIRVVIPRVLGLEKKGFIE